MRALPVLLELALLVYCLIDAIQTPDTEVRHLPKLVWVLLIVLVPLAGGIAWLLVGRADRQVFGGGAGERSSAPDDDPEFLAGLSRRQPHDEPTSPGAPSGQPPSDRPASDRPAPDRPSGPEHDGTEPGREPHDDEPRAG